MRSLKRKIAKQARSELGKGDAKGKGKGKGRKGNNRSRLVPGSVAKAIPNGQRLCPDFQKGTCSNATDCPKGQHRCAMVLQGGRVCGMNNHGAHNCNNRNRV